ncbi:MAG: hypothetical protein IT236_07370 [Bacteroidia bacterium]|nr:hypothetical protein [Bacteroidia bacterium]
MKKSIFTICILSLFFACKKKTTPEFVATDATGNCLLKGNVSKNVITPNGSGGWNNNTKIAAANVNVSVKVDKNSLYPNSTAQGADVYNATTDNNGNYSIVVKANATGVNAQITIDGFTATLDTVLSSGTKTGLNASYTGLTQSRTLMMGQNTQLDYSFFGVPVNSNTNSNIKIGNATVTGSVGVSYIKQVATGTLITLTTTNVPVQGRTVYLSFSNDPNTQATRLYTTTTNSIGYYSFNISTVAANTPGFNLQNAQIWITDYAATRDTLKLNNTVVTGREGVFQGQSLNQNSIFNDEIRNANHFNYSGFTPN